MILFILANVIHMKIGVQVVIEDYVYNKNQKFTLLILNTFFAWAIGLACVFAILKISFGV
jgi:succinate dehydrogenase / fumarate reductase membrane anchor subunit